MQHVMKLSKTKPAQPVKMCGVPESLGFFSASLESSIAIKKGYTWIFKVTLVQIKFWGSLTWTALDRCYGPSTPP